MNLPTQARSALHYALEEFRRPRVRRSQTWLCIMKQQLKNKLSMNSNEEFYVAEDKNVWKTLIKEILCNKYISSDYV